MICPQGRFSLASAGRTHVAELFQVQVPFDSLTQQMRGMAALGAGAFKLTVECLAVVRMHAVVDDCAGPLAGCQAA